MTDEIFCGLLHIGRESLMFFRSLTVVALAVLVVSCTTRDWYEGSRQTQKGYCQTLPDTERQRCLDKVGDDYGTYTREREAVKKASEEAAARQRASKPAPSAGDSAHP